MNQTSDFDFIEDENGGRFVPVGGPIVHLRQMLARGDVDGAVQLYEDTGSVSRDGLIEEALTASLETKKSIAQMFKRARDFAAAAKVFQQARIDVEAAPCFEQANDFASAGASWARTGEVIKAAEAFERAGDTDQALEMFKKGGAHARIAECLVRGHRYFEAAQAFRALKNTHAEVETLRTGLSAEPTNVDVAARLAELMMQHGRKEQAAQLLMETTKRAPAARDHVPFLQLLAIGLEALGNTAAAAKVKARLEELPKGEPPIIQATELVDTAPTADAYGFLKAIPMFASLALPDMKALYRGCTVQAYAAGQHLIEPGQPGKGLFVIVDGQVEVYASASATARLLNTLGVGSYVGEISLIQDGPTSARVTARAAVKALFISRDTFKQFLHSAPSAALRIYQLFTFNLAERVRVLSAAK